MADMGSGSPRWVYGNVRSLPHPEARSLKGGRRRECNGRGTEPQPWILSASSEPLPRKSLRLALRCRKENIRNLKGPGPQAFYRLGNPEKGLKVFIARPEWSADVLWGQGRINTFESRGAGPILAQVPMAPGAKPPTPKI